MTDDEIIEYIKTLPKEQYLEMIEQATVLFQETNPDIDPRSMGGMFMNEFKTIIEQGN